MAITGVWAERSDAVVNGNLDIAVTDENGMPVHDAVVTIHSASGISGPVRFPWANEMAQEDIAFQPGTLIVPKGATVRFPNHDQVRHNVYSFSKVARFEFKLYGRDQTKAYRFGEAGSAALGCNIHDEMQGFIKIVDTPYAAKTDVNGLVSLDALPTGKATISIWHPDLRARENEASQSLVIESGSARRSFKLKLR